MIAFPGRHHGQRDKKAQRPIGKPPVRHEYSSNEMRLRRDRHLPADDARMNLRSHIRGTALRQENIVARATSPVRLKPSVNERLAANTVAVANKATPHRQAGDDQSMTSGTARSVWS